MRTTVTIPEGQIEQVDRIATRLGMKRLQCINFLITLAISQEQVKGATVDTAEGTNLLARLAQQEFHDFMASTDSAKQVPVLVTPGLGDKNVRPAKKSAKR